MNPGGIGDWIVRRAARMPEAIALIDGDTGRTVSYAELDSTVAGLAGSLHELGVRRGDRIGVLMENSPDLVEVLFAAAGLGAVVVPVNFRLSAAEIAYLLADSGASVLAVSDPFRDLAAATLAAAPLAVRHVVTETDGAGLGGPPTTGLPALREGRTDDRIR